MKKVKIYTEEKLIASMLSMKTYIEVYDKNVIDKIIEKHLKALQPIELPSDEEIYHSASDWVFRKNPTKWSVNDDTAGDNMGSFLNGAKWMRDKIQGGNK